jgi:hypothetical protein
MTTFVEKPVQSRPDPGTAALPWLRFYPYHPDHLSAPAAAT